MFVRNNPLPRNGLTAAQRQFLSAAGDLGLAAFDELPDVFLFVKDRERRFVYFNHAFTTLMARPGEELLGKRDEDLSPEYLVDHYRADDEAVLDRGERLVGVVELVHNTDGSYDWFTTTKFPVRNVDGDVIGVAGITRSLTKRAGAHEMLLPLEPAIRLISERYHEQLSLAELAQSVAMSPTHFARRFKEHFGVSPHRYLRRIRLEAACDLLSTTELPVGDIATSVGYYDHSHFTKDFVRNKGLTPSEYRARYRQAPLRRPFSHG